MKTISTKEELKKALEGGEKEVKVEDAKIIGIVGAGLVIGGATISAAEIIVIGGIILALVAILKGHKIKGIDMKHGVVRFE